MMFKRLAPPGKITVGLFIFVAALAAAVGIGTNAIRATSAEAYLAECHRQADHAVAGWQAAIDQLKTAMARASPPPGLSCDGGWQMVMDLSQKPVCARELKAPRQ